MNEKAKELLQGILEKYREEHKEKFKEYQKNTFNHTKTLTMLIKESGERKTKTK